MDSIFLPFSQILTNDHMVLGSVAFDRDLTKAISQYNGNVTELGQTNVIGVAPEFRYGDGVLYAGVKVVDKRAWERCAEGVYKGLLIRVHVDSILDSKLIDNPNSPTEECVLFKFAESFLDTILKSIDSGQSAYEKFRNSENIEKSNGVGEYVK